ncbi:abortive infection system antitoxin AbiGi family protein [Nakamurella sp.]|uniref:abortive infection system antitoxin AbiGi family protein n=1 Tax=Nakamurella sp. TaxID=1869182 RepID=UPI003B3BE083
MSDYLVHMTHADLATGRQNLLSIIRQGRVNHSLAPTGTCRNVPGVPSQYTTSFSEIPMGYLDRLIERHGRYGVGFRRTAVIDAGGSPVWYLPPTSPAQRVFQEAYFRGRGGDIDYQDPIWQCSPFIDNPANGGSWRFEWQWEREWRVLGPFDFDAASVALIFAPEDDHGQLDAEISYQLTGDCEGWWGESIFIDPHWSIEVIQQVIPKTGRVLPDGPAAGL